MRAPSVRNYQSTMASISLMKWAQSIRVRCSIIFTCATFLQVVSLQEIYLRLHFEHIRHPSVRDDQMLLESDLALLQSTGRLIHLRTQLESKRHTVVHKPQEYPPSPLQNLHFDLVVLSNICSGLSRCSWRLRSQYFCFLACGFLNTIRLQQAHRNVTCFTLTSQLCWFIHRKDKKTEENL